MKNIIEKNIYGEKPDISIVDAAKAELRAEHANTKKSFSIQKKAFLSVCACLIFSVVVVFSSMPFWPANNKQPTVFLQSDLNAIEINDIVSFCNNNDFNAKFISSEDVEYKAYSSKYGSDKIIYISQTGTVDNYIFCLYAVDNNFQNKIENVNDNLPLMPKSYTLYDISVVYADSENQITAAFEHNGYAYTLKIDAITEEYFIILLNNLLK